MRLTSLLVFLIPMTAWAGYTPPSYSTVACTKQGTWNIDSIVGTVNVAAASLPLPAGASTETTLAGIKTGTDKIPASPATDRTTAAAPFSCRISDGAAFKDPTQIRALTSGDQITVANFPSNQNITVDGTKTTASTMPAGGSGAIGWLSGILQQLVAGINVTIQNATLAVTQSGTWVIGASANLIGKVGIDQTTPGTTNKVSIGTDGTVSLTAGSTVGVTNAAAVAKGTQGANGLPTQDLKDSGRSARTILLDGFAIAAATETLHTMSFSTDNGTATTGTSYSVTSAKRLRIQQIVGTLHTIAGNTTAATCILRIRANAAGAAIVTSPVQFVMALPSTAAANSSAGPVVTQFPDGWEFAASTGIGVTSICPGFVATTAAPKLNVTITGYEY